MDQPRLLARTGANYTTSTFRALEGEPEAVSEDEQWLITRQAQDRELRTWETTKQRLLAEVAHLKAHIHSPHVDRAARALEREIAALDRKLSG